MDHKTMHTEVWHHAERENEMLLLKTKIMISHLKNIPPYTGQQNRDAKTSEALFSHLISTYNFILMFSYIPVSQSGVHTMQTAWIKICVSAIMLCNVYLYIKICDHVWENSHSRKEVKPGLYCTGLELLNH